MEKVNIQGDHCEHNTHVPQKPELPVGWDSMSEKWACVECMFDIHDLLHSKYQIELVNGSQFSFPSWEFIPPEPAILANGGEVILAREYWYYLVWTVAPSQTIEAVRENIALFVKRDLGLIYVDISLEHGELNGREHYNMRIKSSRSIKKQRFAHYEKIGKINYQIIRKHTEENWTNVGNYCSKESDIETLIE